MKRRFLNRCAVMLRTNLAIKEKLEGERVIERTARLVAPLISIRLRSSRFSRCGPSNPITSRTGWSAASNRPAAAPLIGVLLLAIAFTAQRQICPDAIVSAANAITPRRLSFASASFILRNKVAVF